MARTRQQIRDEMNNAAGAYPTILAKFNNPELGSIFYSLREVFISAVITLESIFDAFREDVNGILVPSRIGTRAWYKDRALLYQTAPHVIRGGVGDPIYEVIDDEARLVTFAYVIEETINNERQVSLRVAKDTTENERGLINLTDEELGAYTSNYWNIIRLFGINLSVQSPVPDGIAIGELHIHYDESILSDTGALLRDPTVFPVRDAVVNYIKTLNEDKGFTIIDFLCAVRDAEGFTAFAPRTTTGGADGNIEVVVTLGRAQALGGNIPLTSASTAEPPHFPFAGYYTIESGTLDIIEYNNP